MESFQMTQENKSEGSEGPNQLSGKRDSADGEDVAPFKKRVRFLSSDDLKEVTNDKTESSGNNNDDVKVSSTSGFSDAGEENKKEIIPIQKISACTTCNEDKSSASLSQLAISGSGDTGNEHGGTDGGGKHKKENEDLREHTAEVGGSGGCSQTGTTVPGTRSGQNIEGGRLEDIQEATMNDGSDGSSSAPRRREEKSKRDIIYCRRRRAKQRSSRDEKPVQDRSTPEGEIDNIGDGLQDAVGEESHIQKTEGGTKLTVDRSSEDERHEEVQNSATEVGEMSHDDGGECLKDEMVPEDDCSGDAPDVVGEAEHIPKVGETKQEDSGGACLHTGLRVEFEADRIDEALEAEVKDGNNGSGAPSGEEPSKVENNLVEEDESEMIQDGDACGKEETNTIIEGSSGGKDEGDGEEQGIHSPMENEGLDNNNNSAPTNEEPMEGGEKPSDYIVSTMIIIHDGGHGCSDNSLADNTAGSSEVDRHEQRQPAAMEDGVNENIRNSEIGIEEQDNKGKEPVEGDRHEQGQVLAAMESGNENVIISNSEAGVEEQSKKGKEPVEADLHEQGQQESAIEDGGNENAADDVVVSGEEVQDKKGKKPVEYVPSGKNPESDVVRNKEQPDHQGTNPDANDGSVVSTEGDHNNQIQQVAFEDPDTEIVNKNVDANSSGDMDIQGDMQTQQAPMTTIDLRKRTRSIPSHGVVGDDTPGQEARKKCKFGSDGGSTSAHGAVEPRMQQLPANRSFLLFGASIPREQEPDFATNTNVNDGPESGGNHAAGGELANGSVPPPQQPTNGIQLFGVYMTEEQVQPVAKRGIQLFGAYMITGQPPVGMQNGDQGNSHGGGESSMQRPKSGLRLFGFDI